MINDKRNGLGTFLHHLKKRNFIYDDDDEYDLDAPLGAPTVPNCYLII